MHYYVQLLTKKLPSEKEIEDIMRPYNSTLLFENCENEDDIEYPVFTYDYYLIGGRYKARIKMKCDTDDKENKDYYNWGFYDPDPRNGRLFWSSLLTTLKENIKPAWCFSEEDWFMNMGFGDRYMLVDGARLKDVVNFDEIADDGYICILPDGSAIARESWNGHKFVEDEDFDSKHLKALKDNMDGFITILDIHD